MTNSKKLPYANKKLGQHFLTNTSVIEKICSDKTPQAEAILEIGPGPGILTKYLSQNTIPYHAIEKDKKFKKYLYDFISENEVTFDDALKIDLIALFSKLNWKKLAIWLVSNLPYNISVPLLIRFIQIKKINYMTLMFQKEVGEKIVTIENKKNQMNSLMALTQSFFETSTVCKVSKGSFTPPPEVESIVISLARLKNPNIKLDDFFTFESFLKKIFTHKRKQIGTILKKHYDKNEIDGALSSLKLTSKQRAETFSLSNVQNLYKILVLKEKENGY